MASLQDQLLNAGMVDKKKAKEIEKGKRKQAKQAKQKPKGYQQPNEIREQAQQALKQKAAHAKETNRVREEAAQQKAVMAQIKQLIEVNKIARDGEISFQFVDGKKIKKLYISAVLQNQLSKGQIAIVKLAEQYELVPTAVAEKIQQRDESIIMLLNDSHSANSDTNLDDEDPYADFVVPDDLMW